MSWDSRQFEQCFRERYPELVQFLHGLTGDRAAAEDVAQEALVRLWSRGPSARPGADYWVFRVARNLALDWVKAEARRNHRARADESPGDAGGYEDEDLDRVRALVHELAPRDREVLVLREFTGLSYAEIAAVVGRGVDAVKQDLFQARQRLRRAWQEKYGGDR